MPMTRGSLRGFTLIELVIGLVVAAIVGTTAISIAVRQEHLAFALEQIMETRRALREGADALRYDLRATAPPRGGIYAMGDTYLEFRMATGFSILCGLDSSRTLLVFPSRSSSAANLTSWISAPEAGDTVLVFTAHADADSARWDAYAIASAPTSGRGCSADFRPPDAIASTVSVRLTSPVPQGVGPGAALRFIRRARYELYKSADGGWYLGFRDCLATRATPCAIVQPVSGPYSAGGMRFVFRDSADVPTADPSRVTRIDVMMRAASVARLHLPGIRPGVFVDSVLFTIRPRR